VCSIHWREVAILRAWVLPRRVKGKKRCVRYMVGGRRGWDIAIEIGLVFLRCLRGLFGFLQMLDHHCSCLHTVLIGRDIEVVKWDVPYDVRLYVQLPKYLLDIAAEEATRQCFSFHVDLFRCKNYIQ
jgi:hypothetical protein